MKARLAALLLPALALLAPRACGASFARTATCGTTSAQKLAARRFAFPADDGAHEGFASEWWRTFGRLADAQGKRYDFSVNVSRFRVAACGGAGDSDGRWATHDVVTTTWELVDESGFAVRRGSRTEREGALGAVLRRSSLDLATERVRYRDRPDRSNLRAAFSLALDDRANGLALEQMPDAALPLGPGGVMTTGSCAACEAYAYAYPRSATHGTLRIDGVSHAVTGSTWIEHEFATRELAKTDAGWSRYELQFDDGRDLDARFTRDAGGRIVATSGVYVSADGKIAYLHDGDARLQNVMHTVWRSSPTGVTYPSLWALSVPRAKFYLATVELALDQESRDAQRSPYFTGAVVVERVGPPEADHGHGYVELTGYGTPVSL